MRERALQARWHVHGDLDAGPGHHRRVAGAGRAVATADRPGRQALQAAVAEAATPAGRAGSSPAASGPWTSSTRKYAGRSEDLEALGPHQPARGAGPRPSADVAPCSPGCRRRRRAADDPRRAGAQPLAQPQGRARRRRTLPHGIRAGGRPAQGERVRRGTEHEEGQVGREPARHARDADELGSIPAMPSPRATAAPTCSVLPNIDSTTTSALADRSGAGHEVTGTTATGHFAAVDHAGRGRVPAAILQPRRWCLPTTSRSISRAARPARGSAARGVPRG